MTKGMRQTSSHIWLGGETAISSLTELDALGKLLLLWFNCPSWNNRGPKHVTVSVAHGLPSDYRRLR